MHVFNLQMDIGNLIIKNRIAFEQKKKICKQLLSNGNSAGRYGKQENSTAEKLIKRTKVQINHTHELDTNLIMWNRIHDTRIISTFYMYKMISIATLKKNEYK